MKSLKSSRGGRRSGAGRKKGHKWPSTIAKEVARELTRKAITAELLPMIEAQIAKAKGIKFLVTRDKSTGKFIPVTAALLKELAPEDLIEVWEKTPDTQAFNTLTDRALDKSKEQEVDLNVNGDLVIKWQS